MNPAEKLKLLRKRFRELKKEHDLDGWTFDLDTAKSRLGHCTYSKKSITISKKHVRQSPIKELMNTLTHEVAHAICGSKENHGPRWKKTHKRLGGNGQRCGQRLTTTYYYSVSCPNQCLIGFDGDRNPIPKIYYIRRPRIHKTHICKCGSKLVLRKEKKTF